MRAVENISSADRALFFIPKLVARLSIAPICCTQNISGLKVKTTKTDLIELIKMFFMV